MKLNFRPLSLLVMSIAIILQACGGDSDSGVLPEPTPEDVKVTISTPQISDVTYENVTAKAVITNPAGSKIVKKGFCYSTSPSPTISSQTANVNSVGATLECYISGLEAETTYYIRAYATFTNADPVYSNETTFTTSEAPVRTPLDEYIPPTYADNYANISGWGERHRWNLANVHDPTVVLAEDGYYYMYQTDASYGNEHMKGGHFHGRRSKDLVNWEYLGGTMQSLPEWVIPKLNEIRTAMGLPEKQPNVKDFGYWAPCVRKVRDGLYRMYYSIVCPGVLDESKESWGERAFIGVMENSDPANNDGWVDKGYVITNASEKGLNFYVHPQDWANCYFKWNAIDPSYIITPEGEHWLIYGSWHSGIAALQVDAETGKPTDLPLAWGNNEEIAPYGKLIATRQMGNRWQGSEGPEVIYNPETGYYYLFMAYDALDVPYNTRVVRSKNIDGPYVGIDGTNVTDFGGDMYPIVTHPYKFKNSHGWVGISHCCVFDDGEGNWYYASQGRLPADVDGNAYSNAIMMGHVRSIRWTEDGWPVVMPERYGAVPQLPITEEELVGTWEHIDLGYRYGEQKGSDYMVFGDSHKITSGIWKDASWSYDADRQILTANGVKLYLQREVDWEANPRTHTIVYVGLNNKKTYWGKKCR